MIPVTAVLSGVLVCEAVCALLVDKDCPQPLLCAQLKEPLTLPNVPYEFRLRRHSHRLPENRSHSIVVLNDDHVADEQIFCGNLPFVALVELFKVLVLP